MGDTCCCCCSLEAVALSKTLGLLNSLFSEDSVDADAAAVAGVLVPRIRSSKAAPLEMFGMAYCNCDRAAKRSCCCCCCCC